MQNSMMPVVSDIDCVCSFEVVGPCGFHSTEGARLQVRVMKNLNLEKWKEKQGTHWTEKDLDDSTALIVSALIEGGFNSFDQADELRETLLKLVGWGMKSTKLSKWATFDGERVKPDSHLKEESRCVHRLLTGWKRTLHGDNN